MATDVYGKRKMFSSGTIFLILVPIGAIAIFFAYDFFMNIYKQAELEKHTKEVLEETLNREGLENLEEMKIFASKVFEEYGITEDNYSLMQFDDYYILTSYDYYISVVGELSFGLIRNKEGTVYTSYKGYYNEYKEAVVEKYNEDPNETLYEEKEDNNEVYEDIIIN